MKQIKLPRKLPKSFEGLVRMHMPRAIHDDVEYENTQEVIDRLTSLPQLTEGQEEYLDTLSILFATYEDEHFSINNSKMDSVEVLEFLLEEHEMSSSDLGRILGDRSLGSRILCRKRSLSKTHIRKLCDHFHVSSDLFLDKV